MQSHSSVTDRRVIVPQCGYCNHVRTGGRTHLLPRPSFKSSFKRQEDTFLLNLFELAQIELKSNK